MSGNDERPNNNEEEDILRPVYIARDELFTPEKYFEDIEFVYNYIQEHFAPLDAKYSLIELEMFTEMAFIQNERYRYWRWYQFIAKGIKRLLKERAIIAETDDT